ncbi:hypothetical protein ACOZ35_03320 [Halorubrum xinjiangense]|uniref:hypothetical protein n=1 Tax=Halorubrum xinjiangense TaxID=261291 RepID=UPI003C6EB7F2
MSKKPYTPEDIAEITGGDTTDVEQVFSNDVILAPEDVSDDEWRIALNFAYSTGCSIELFFDACESFEAPNTGVGGWM